MFRYLLPAMLAGVLAGCGEERRPEAVRESASDAPATAAPPTTPSGDPALAGALPPEVTGQMVQEGARIYAGQGICFTCHGPQGSGSPLAPALNDRRWVNVATGSYEELVTVIRTGVADPVEYPAPMPPMGGARLSEDQLRAVAAYVFALSRGVG